MRSEPDECALGVDLRGLHSAFYFYQSEARNADSASSVLNLAAAWPAIHDLPREDAGESCWGVAIAMEHCTYFRQIGAYRATLHSRSHSDLSKECIKHSPSLPAVAR
jgi:hypothetical protein